ncbi:Outer membrane receptor proteins, mostly Fe transport [Chitinophaga costaii]|uniref:Outer membrane receptor proteins, mostly Fe transport n=1 Tax=Chitinophaga costaii TaxID=1335309 RepID=A0A1C4G060_9BACT|nr:TonB-dependent receptor [Chitinophaga costaii]SCC61323.1 Outer membrane receptor proteins, mostly Fe transport [Chitinophaga costaii]
MFKYPLILLLLGAGLDAHAQTVQGVVYDALTREPLPMAGVCDAHQHCTLTGANGHFTITTSDSLLSFSMHGYQSMRIRRTATMDVPMQAIYKDLQTVVVSASRTAEQRSEAPVAISTINAQAIADTKANRLDQLLNQVSGVMMVNLGNEQHEMSIRQPMTTKSLFLYLEDGIPIRSTGVYNHNAMLELNMAAARQIEIIKGPASALYGAEAIGGAVNIITAAPPAIPGGTLSVQANNNGYKRADLQAGASLGKWGLLVSGYYANRKNGPIDYSDFHKTAVTLRADYKASAHTLWSNSITLVDYYSDMTGALDSTHFTHKDYSTPYSFTYRKTYALRARSSLSHRWNEHAETQVSAVFRDNSVKQNPSYYIYNDYHKTNGVYVGDPLLAHGQLNDNAFSSYSVLMQHQQGFHFLQSKLIAGLSGDFSPSNYWANYIRIQRSAKGNYIGYTKTDSSLSNYSTGISNLAAYLNYELSPVRGLKVVAALRYDQYRYNYKNHLPASAYSGAPSTVTNYSRVTPKLGFTYNYHQVGVYGNYSQGFVPPQITDLFGGVKVPFLDSQTFYNYEVGGWLSLFQQRLYADISLYRMNGTHEIISVLQDDGTFRNQSAGKTRHTGVEYGVTYHPAASWTFRLSATNAKHTFQDYTDKGVRYAGKDMAAAPHFTANLAATWKPGFLKGLRLGVEWQHQGRYWMDNANTSRYGGFEVINARAGYQFSRFEVWTNALNVGNTYYATMASSSGYGKSYNLGDPREFNVGFSCRFGK